jgi:type IV secretory pathway component VirB8
MQPRPSDTKGNFAETIRSGAYFAHAKSWYFLLFSNPIAERTFYILTATIAGLTLAIAVLAVLFILPVTSTFPFHLQNNRTDTKVPQMIKLRRDHTETQDAALTRFYLKQYVDYRESYSQAGFALSDKFVANYSDQANLQAYRAMMDVGNPQSPKLLFADPWMRRVITVQEVLVNTEIQPYQALVHFTAVVRGGNTNEVVPFVADVRFLYSPLQVVNELDSVTGQLKSKFTEPQFQVVGYQVRQTTASEASPGYRRVR